MTSTGGLPNVMLRTGELNVYERRAALGWGISWLPAFTLLSNDLLAWPAIFLIFSELRTLLFGAPGEIVWQMLIIPAIVTALTFHILGGYDRRTNMLSLSYSVEHFLGLAVAMMVSATLVYGLCTFGSMTQQPSRPFFFLAFTVFGAHALATRRWITVALRTHHAGRHFVLLADADVAARFATLFRQREMGQELRIFSNFEDAASHLNANADGLIVGYKPSSLDPQLGQFLAYVHFRHIPVYTLESFHETFWRQVPVQSIEAWWAFARESLLVRDSIYDHVKRVFDFVVAVAGLILCAPLMLLVAILVRLESPGPAIFRQTRIGRDGRPFTLFKFRSMRKGAESGSMYTEDRDPRVTRVGQVLRKTRMDELPQLWNVLRGDMSIIGPRAEWIKCVERYDGAIPFYGYRHLVRPGITGWAQVNYSYGASSEDAEEKLKYDLYYIRHYSMALDFAIILKTLQTMLFAKGR
jgi:exopolysaccharide biosynthesis polyprenyl glycosylphosphotransferase